MLTIKQITENTDAVIRGLEKKHFKGAKETIAQVIEVNDKRRNTQNQLDKNLAEVNSLSKTIGQLMKEGKKEEAEVMPKEPCNTGISTELIPNANPMAKNMMPINANGRAKFF